MILSEFRQQLRQLTVQELEDKIALYQDSQSRGISDEVLLSCYEAEMERRILAWEAQQ